MNESKNTSEGKSARIFLQNSSVLKELEDEKRGDIHTEQSRRISIGIPHDRINSASKFSASSTQIANEFLERSERWALRRNEKLEAEREKRVADELAGCTFMPETQNRDKLESFRHQQTDKNSKDNEYKMVFAGKTYDLASDGDLRQLFVESLEKSGQRSVFRRNYDKLNKIYSVMLK